MTIDLHGLPHQTAIKLVEDKLTQASLKGSFDAEIITGKSVIMQRFIVKEVLDSWGSNMFALMTIPELST
jgi:DNA-nicking Smr family endonuclease